jgi:apolipoprotein D and lipocalin family protein
MNATEYRPQRIVRLFLLIAILTFLMLMTGCQSSSSLGPIRTEESVDLHRFMGDWYVIANIPTFIEKEAYNALETYELEDDGRRVNTTFTFNKGGFDGPLKEYNPTGFVREGTGNAVWGMQFIWPIKAEYRIVYVDDAYTQTIIGRTKRDYVWVMARTPQISDAEYAKLLSIVEEAGYNMDELRSVPQQPLDDR